MIFILLLIGVFLWKCPLEMDIITKGDMTNTNEDIFMSYILCFLNHSFFSLYCKNIFALSYLAVPSVYKNTT